MATKNKALRIGCLVVVGIFFLAIVAYILIFTVGYQYASWYTEEQHLARIAERVEKRYFSKGSDYGYTDYEVFPLYDENEKFSYALVEFEPQGFVYIKISVSYFLFRLAYQVFPAHRYILISGSDPCSKTLHLLD